MKDYCNVANQGCKQPAGYLVSGAGYATNNNLPLLDIPECYRCGMAVCNACAVIYNDKAYCPECLREQKNDWS